MNFVGHRHKVVLFMVMTSAIKKKWITCVSHHFPQVLYGRCNDYNEQDWYVRCNTVRSSRPGYLPGSRQRERKGKGQDEQTERIL
jgi:hypothetical protein